MPEGKYSAESMQRVARMRMRVLKKGSAGMTQWSREVARDLEEETSNDKPRRTSSMSCRVSKLLAGGAP